MYFGYFLLLTLRVQLRTNSVAACRLLLAQFQLLSLPTPEGSGTTWEQEKVAVSKQAATAGFGGTGIFLSLLVLENQMQGVCCWPCAYPSTSSSSSLPAWELWLAWGSDLARLGSSALVRVLEGYQKPPDALISKILWNAFSPIGYMFFFRFLPPEGTSAHRHYDFDF